MIVLAIAEHWPIKRRADSGSVYYAAASLLDWATLVTFVFPHLCLGSDHLRLDPFVMVTCTIPTLASALALSRKE